MQLKLDIDSFIKQHVTKREESLLKPDFEKYRSEMESSINGEKVLVESFKK
jgi:hypothetical protein